LAQLKVEKRLLKRALEKYSRPITFDEEVVIMPADQVPILPKVTNIAL
jgi:hypothetical protein